MYLDAYQAGAANGNTNSTALCVDVRIHVPGKMDKTDAIQIMLEHSGGEALDAFMPYEKHEEAEIIYAPLFATPADPRVFVKLASEKEQ